MRFADIFLQRRRPVISFEVFPPKTDAALESFRAVLPKLTDLRPDFMTVTYGAFGSTRSRTLEIARMIKLESRLEAACHLTCVGSTRADLERILGEIGEASIENIVALRGDPPQGQASFVPPPGGFRNACELVKLVRGAGRFGIAVAAYPEKHLEAPDFETDLAHLQNKVATGADIVITQLFYDNRHYWRLVERARALGVKVPIVPGLLPILSLTQVKRITSMCGSTIPPDLLGRLEAAGTDEAAALEVGVRQAVDQAIALIGGGAPGIHFYVLNKHQHMARIMKELRPVLEAVEG